MAEFSLTEATNLFKINYYKKSENMYNNANVTLARIKVKNDFTGKERYLATPMSFSGGVGSGTLPVAGVADYKDAHITSKRVYATCQIEREAIKASADDAGAFVRATKEVVMKCVESASRNNSRILFNDGSGVLGMGDGTGTNVTGAGTSGNPYVITFPASKWKEANFEERDIVQMVSGYSVPGTGTMEGGTATTNHLTIQEVVPSLRQIKVVGTSAILAADVAAPRAIQATEAVCMQGSLNNDPQGLKGVLDATSGTLYGITVQRRWQAFQKAAAGAGISPDLMNEVMLGIEQKFGQAPNMIVTSYTQYRKLLNQLEDHKRYQMPPRDSSLKGYISFEGVEFMSTRGSIGVFPDRFVENDRMYFINDNFIECHRRPGFGWMDDDGTVFLRKDGIDSYEARYGGYYDNYITPTAHGVLTGLAT